eukprot:TRINITY_DN8785_c0_g1_i3.p1 TRINITY_DN8785_c0_g1~~TRINITY_DN8785_c0_g1_i3.p1  ORF type:complete len:332 (-),score=47.64 TRINITY_DN8785_c0_g1_i3:81-1076(-)
MSTTPPSSSIFGSFASFMKSAVALPASDPFIAGVDPLVCPKSGGTITISGKNLTHKVVVRVAGSPAQLISRRGDDVVVKTAPSDTEGFKDIEVINEDGMRYVLSDVLIYSDAVFEATSGSALPSTTPPKGVDPNFVSNSPRTSTARVFGKGAGGSSSNLAAMETAAPFATIGTVDEFEGNAGVPDQDSMPSPGSTLPLSIEIVHPAVAPLSGASVMIALNRAVSRDVTVKIGGISAKPDFKDRRTLIVHTPPMRAVGPKSIVVNDGRDSKNEAILEGGLMYIDNLPPPPPSDTKAAIAHRRTPSTEYSSSPKAVSVMGSLDRPSARVWGKQ